MNNKSKEEFSTSYSHCEYLGTADIKTPARSSVTCTCSSSSTLNLKELKEFNFPIVPININFNSSLLQKKIEEMENAYNEILKNFNFLAAKYKMIKEEKNKVEECNVTLISQITGLSEEYNRICSELGEANFTIERFKEIDKCLVDSTINSLFLNTNEKRLLNSSIHQPLGNLGNSTSIDDNCTTKSVEQQSGNFRSKVQRGGGYILCEPVPSFVKFINKFTK